MKKVPFASYLPRLAVLFAIAFFSTALFAATVDGTWSGDAHLPNGRVVPVVVHLKAEGNVLTGTLDPLQAGAKPDPVMGGMIHGNKFSFYAMRTVQGMQRRFNYTGDLMENKIDFTISPEGATGAPNHLMLTKK